MAMTRVLYDDQCEICQAFVSWLRLLDRQGLTEIVPIEIGTVQRHGLTMDACAGQLHIVTPAGVRAGWDAV